ncbi:sensor histidine kinase [Clavibacter michiganensis]|uniref:histidine kinase n=1 Tax=Clavibacter michiganensis TaxID=28447 RepID=A0A251YJA1_9MICO|nr:sensor histidine kinase [Clavibacter michiganensis]OUE24233.1 Oxygen sensor histidine kinase NreB [Clavibacter michiganensis]
MSAGLGEAPDLAELQVRRLGPVGRFLARRPAVGDAALIACFAAWALFTGVGADSMYALHVHLGDDTVLRIQTASLVLTAAGCALLVARRRRPVVVAAGMAVLGLGALALTGAPSGFDLGLALALHAVAVSRRPLVTWAVFVPAVGAMLVAARILPLPLQVGAVMSGLSPDSSTGPDPLLGGWQPIALPVLVLALLAVAVGTGVRSRRLHLARIVEAAEAVAREAEQRTRLAEAAERARIAREMHDVVAHSISVMVALGGGASMALDWAPDRARLALDELVGTGRTALADMRRVLGVLHDDPPADTADPADPAAAEPSVAPLPGIRDLAALLDRFRLAGLPVRATGIADPRLARVDATLQLAVHRIVQEALTNALRHAPGTAAVEVAIRLLPGRMEVVVADQGPGVPVERTPGSGRGVLGMRERAAAFGGTVDAGPHGRGWRVRAELPWDDEEDDA